MAVKVMSPEQLFDSLAQVTGSIRANDKGVKAPAGGREGDAGGRARRRS